MFRLSWSMNIVAAAWIACCVVSPAAGDDRFEDNPTRAGAARIGVAPGVHLAGLTIDVADDVDWYSFVLLREDDVDLTLTFDNSAGNLDVEITDADGVVIDLGISTDDDERISLADLPEGTYFVHVYGVGGAVNTYGLSIEPGAESTSRVFYVNDSETVDDVYTTAAGDNANSGLAPDIPKATLQSILDDHDLVPTDLVLIDTGDYSGPATITVADEGAFYAGSPFGSNFTYGGTRIGLDDADFNMIYFNQEIEPGQFRLKSH